MSRAVDLDEPERSKLLLLQAGSVRFFANAQLFLCFGQRTFEIARSRANDFTFASAWTFGACDLEKVRLIISTPNPILWKLQPTGMHLSTAGNQLSLSSAGAPKEFYLTSKGKLCIAFVASSLQK